MMACLGIHMGGLHVGNSCVVVCLDTGMLARLGCIGMNICMACGLLCGRSMTLSLAYGGFVSRWCSLRFCILYTHYMVIEYVLGVWEDRPERAYGLIVLWLECREH